MDNPCPSTPMLVFDPWLYFWLLRACNPALVWELVHFHEIGSLNIPREFVTSPAQAETSASFFLFFSQVSVTSLPILLPLPSSFPVIP